MTSRAEVTYRYAVAYAKASKKAKGKLLDEVVSATGWSRENVRRRLVAAAQESPGPGRAVAKRARKHHGRGYSYDALWVLRQVWAASGGQCGKYLAASMKLQLDLLEAHGELVCGDEDDQTEGRDRGRCNDGVRATAREMTTPRVYRGALVLTSSGDIEASPTPEPLPSFG